MSAQRPTAAELRRAGYFSAGSVRIIDRVGARYTLRASWTDTVPGLCVAGPCEIASPARPYLARIVRPDAPNRPIIMWDGRAHPTVQAALDEAWEAIPEYCAAIGARIIERGVPPRIPWVTDAG